jgi:hypothetical protein
MNDKVVDAWLILWALGRAKSYAHVPQIIKAENKGIME